ncbi:protein of unknown function [Nitrospira japonica]|uniref:Uncharacterized protein n=1 Tax=Nitrospira japonica TaxID=1325564 RepID=A0A1W1I376_9BACT|nr:protein of unknown function [Nitrospira japonica]
MFISESFLPVLRYTPTPVSGYVAIQREPNRNKRNLTNLKLVPFPRFPLFSSNSMCFQP